MSAKLPLKNDLQKEFATRAEVETKALPIWKFGTALGTDTRYILPWTREYFRKSSSLDPIYIHLGENFNKANYFNELNKRIQKVKASKKKGKYSRTLVWLENQVLRGDYVQQGNSCGAWSLTHWQMRRDKRYYGATDFRTKAQANYNIVKFDPADGKVTPKPAILSIWSNPPTAVSGAPNPAYTNPWKIVEKMPGSELKILKSVKTFASTGGTLLAKCFGDMLTAIEALGPAAPSHIPEGDLSTLPIGSCAIITLYQNTLMTLPVTTLPAASNAVPLHYMLVARSTAGWEIFNSNSHKMNTTDPILTSCPKFQDTITHNVIDKNGAGGGTDTWKFLGLFIS